MTLSFDEISRPRPEHVPWGPPYWDEFFDTHRGVKYCHPNGRVCTMRESMYLYEAHERTSFRVWRKQVRARSRVAESFVGPYRISTIFLRHDHSFSIWDDAIPILFETMVFEREESRVPADAEYFAGRTYHKDIDDLSNRYHTRREALQGHWATRKLVRRWLQLANGPAGGWRGKKK